MDDLVADVELDLAFEDVERVAVSFVEVGVDAASRLQLELERRELGASGFDDAHSQNLALARGQRDRIVHSDSLLDEAQPLAGQGFRHEDELLPGHAAKLPRELCDDNGRRIDAAVLGRVELVEVGIAPAHVVREAERRHVEVEAARVAGAVVVEAMDDAWREDDERPRRERAASRREDGT